MTSASWAEISLAAIRWNIEHILSITRRRVIAVVKANAYGHGMIAVSRGIADLVSMFAVATLDEALELAAHVTDVPVLNLFPVLPDQMEAVVKHGIHQVVHSTENLRAINCTATEAGCPAHVHLKIDTGMHRIGFTHSEVAEVVSQVSACSDVVVDGISTHLACSDELENDYTPLQLQRFRSVLQQFREADIVPEWIHASNSAGVLHWPDSYFNAVRPGLLVYGLPPALGAALPFGPKPALTWKSRVSQVKRLASGEPIGYGGTHRLAHDTTVVTIPVGYADGYRRSLSNSGRVLIRGQSANILGRVCMDQIMCDVSDIGEVSVGDEVVLLGRQGSGHIPVQEHARLAETIHYEILTGIGARVKRLYTTG